MGVGRPPESRESLSHPSGNFRSRRASLYARSSSNSAGISVSATYFPPNWPKWPRLSGTFCIDYEAPDFLLVLDSRRGLDAARAVHRIRIQRGDFADVVRRETAGNKRATQI